MCQKSVSLIVITEKWPSRTSSCTPKILSSQNPCAAFTLLLWERQFLLPRLDKVGHQRRRPRTESRSVGLMKLPIILLHWVGWARSPKQACDKLKHRLSNQGSEVELLELLSDRPTELRNLCCTAVGHQQLGTLTSRPSFSHAKMTNWLLHWLT